MKGTRVLGWVVFLALTGWVGWSTYHYFFDKQNPTVAVVGLADQGYYAGDVACFVNGYHPYKVGKISLFLDGNPLIYNYSISKKQFEHPFNLNTRTLTNGKHTLVVKAVDGTYYKNTAQQEYNFTVDNTPLQAAFIEQDGEKKVFQGRTLHVQLQVNKPLKEAKINVFSKQYDCFKEGKNSLIYETFVPVECEENPTEYPFTVNCIDVVDNVVTLEGKVQVVQFPFKRHTIAVSEEKMKHEREMSTGEDLNQKLAELVEQSPKEKLWNGAFFAPTEIGRISTEFGVLRTTQERGLYAHKAVDIVNTPKSVIWAPQAGKVVIKDRYTFSGNTVVLDHGCGIFSLFFHLDSMPDDIQVGKMVQKGNKIGTLGKTGYATGYHLHWEMRINNTPIDPMQWIKPNLS